MDFQSHLWSKARFAIFYNEGYHHNTIIKADNQITSPANPVLRAIQAGYTGLSDTGPVLGRSARSYRETALK